MAGAEAPGRDGFRDTAGNYGADAVGAPMAARWLARTVASIPIEENLR
jgi:hypothetical protein